MYCKCLKGDDALQVTSFRFGSQTFRFFVDAIDWIGNASLYIVIQMRIGLDMNVTQVVSSVLAFVV